ncbi:uncharacterized protein LOC127736076 isoform X1 [Mytilus californianus]|uniref:uncharacterized protein LOC127736076 isoform X1 n=1 Tax=Mytilus californianus TaxID=6549 RepID=UPI0022459569|nr:uncharacterized protein LOC127736076 isoform X1 [Mytilus californianus]
MSISEADDCSHDEAAKLVLENSNSDGKTNRKKIKERKSVRISDDEITFYPSDSGYITSKGENTNLLDDWSEEGCTNILTVEEWTEEVLGTDNVLKDITIPSHDTILKNKVTFCDTPKDNTPPQASEQSVEQTITYSEILILDSPPAGHKNIKRNPSLESRDNPFVPGGSLDQEASDILKRATIIRDQFILSEQRKYSDIEQNPAPENTEIRNEVNNTCENLNKDIIDETILQQSTNSSQALPETKLNGKTILTDSQPVDINQKDGTLDRSVKDKKKQKKCCSVM